MVPKTERYPETSANKAETKSLTRMPTAEKAVKERDCTQMPVAKKERTDHERLSQRKKDQTTNAGGKRKMAALIRQANKRVRNGQQAKEKKERTRGEKEEGGREKQQQHFLKRKKRQVMSPTGQRLDTRNPCTRYNPLSGSDNNTAGQQTLTNYPT